MGSPPINLTQEHLDTVPCIRFKARPCDASKDSQKFKLLPGVKPGDGQPTTVKSAIKHNASCWQARNGGFGNGITCDKFYNENGAKGGRPSKEMDADGCKPVPTLPYDPHNQSMSCMYDQAFVFNPNGTIALANTITVRDNKIAYIHHCLQINEDMSVGLTNCQPPNQTDDVLDNTPSQKWEVSSTADGSITIRQGDLCVDNNYAVYQGPQNSFLDSIVV